MQHVQEMLETHPRASGQPGLADCVTACHDCSFACTACADACLAESMVAELVHCIRLNLDCADVCAATGNMLTRQTEPSAELLHRQLEACVLACRLCAEECEAHADAHEHCRVCAEACRACERTCQEMLQAV